MIPYMSYDTRLKNSDEDLLNRDFYKLPLASN